MGKRKKLSFRDPFDAPAYDVFGAEDSFKAQLIADFSKIGEVDASSDVLCETEWKEGRTSAPFPSWRNAEATDYVDNADKQESRQADKKKETRGRAVSEYEIALKLVNTYSTGLFQNIPYIKLNGVDTPVDGRLVGKLINMSLSKDNKDRISGSTFKHIYTWMQAILDTEESTMQRHPHWIMFENGIVNFLTGEFVTNVPTNKFFFPVQVHASYYPNNPSETPVWDQFLEDCSGGDAAVKKLILEFVGYMLSPCEPDRIFILSPCAASGKSITANLTRELLGMDKTCAIALSNFGKPFHVSQLFGKVANYCLDVSQAVLSDSIVATLKRLSGAGDPETIDRKYLDPFPYINYAKLVFACNENGIKIKGNQDGGIARRLICIPFLHSCPKSRMDRQLKEKLWAERDGIVYQALEALRELHYRNYEFTYTEDGERLLRKYLGRVEPSVQRFVDECCVLSPEERTWTSSLYEEYKKYCAQNGLVDIGRYTFGSEIYDLPGVENHKFQKDYIQRQGAEGICLREQFKSNPIKTDFQY